MKSAEKQHQWQSPEEMRDAILPYKYFTSDIDPHADIAKEHMKNNQESILALIKNHHDFWKYFFEKWRDENMSHLGITMHDEDFVYDYSCEIMGDNFFVTVHTYNKQWFDERLDFLKKVFAKECLHKKAYPIDLLAKKLNIQPTFDFKLKNNDFSTSEIKDALGTKIDFRIKELVLLLNMIGIETDGSCGGHTLDNRKPYLHIRGDKLEQILSIMTDWKQSGGLNYNISPLNIDAESIRLEAPDDVDVKTAQEDIDNLTDWLETKIPDFEQIKLSFLEKIMKLRRKMKKRLK
jgi:hypothetical protein